MSDDGKKKKKASKSKKMSEEELKAKTIFDLNTYNVLLGKSHGQVL